MAVKDEEVSMLALSVGPVQYYWSRKTLIDFYAMVADSRASTVCLGEVVCSRRHEMKLDDWLDLGCDLAQAGKEVVLGSQALIESEAELRTLRRSVEAGHFMVEANDVAAVAQLAGGPPWVIGAHVNVYSDAALAEYAALGAVRWVPPLELGLQDIARVHGPHAQGIACEAFAFGRLPLAWSARCFTARHHHLQKDACEFRCLDDPDGLTLRTRDGQPFLAINGIQTQSASVHCLLGHRSELLEAGVTRLRLSPCSHDFERVLDLFDAVMNRGLDAGEGVAALESLALPGPLSNGYAQAQRPGMLWVSP